MSDLRLIRMESVRLGQRSLTAVMAQASEKVNFGDADGARTAQFAALMGGCVTDPDACYGVWLSWEGSKIPRFEVGGKMVGWTQNGMITAADGTRMGYYERQTEFGGPDRNEHRMVMVITDPDCVAALRASDPDHAPPSRGLR
jgi:hypothetical protein